MDSNPNPHKVQEDNPNPKVDKVLAAKVFPF